MSVTCPLPRVICRRLPLLAERRLALSRVPSPVKSMNVSSSMSRIRAEAEKTRLGAVAHQAERAALIPVGAALEARDRVTDTVRTYSNTQLTRQELNRFERRGAKALGRTRRTVERQTKHVQGSVKNSANDVQSNARNIVDRVLSLS
jgi:hypothetical protein